MLELRLYRMEETGFSIVVPEHFNLNFTAQAFLQRKETKLFWLHRSLTPGFVLAELTLIHSKISN